MIEMSEGLGLVPVVASRLPESDERHHLVARTCAERFARGVLGTELDVPGEKLS